MIHPVRNYKTEVECDHHMDILTLRVLRQILRYSKDFLKDKIERRTEEEKIFFEKVKTRFPELKGDTSFFNNLTYPPCWNMTGKSKGEKQSEGKKAALDDDEDEDVKKWRVVTGNSLIGCPGKRVQTGDTVTEVKPPEDGYVMVATEDGREGSLPVSCVGGQSVIISSM